MERIDQTEFGRTGNCQSACLAMMLGMKLVDVPNFLLEPGADRDDLVSYQACQNWLNIYGWRLVTVPAPQEVFRRHFSNGYIIAGGVSPRSEDLAHACVYLDGQLWHDPHPDRRGLALITEVDVLWPKVPSMHRHFLPITKTYSTFGCDRHRGQSWVGKAEVVGLQPIAEFCPLCEQEQQK